MSLRIVFALLFLLSGMHITAQTCCSAGAPVSTFLDISNADEKTYSFQLNYEYNSINLLVDNNQRLENDPRSRSGQSLSWKFDYVLNSKIAFSAILPFVQHARNTTSEEQSSLGIGDLTLLSQYQVLGNPKHNFNVAAGIKIPLGITGHKGRSGIFLSPDMQSGSGSLDYIFRTSYSRSDVLIPFLSMQASVMYRINGTNNHFGSTENFEGRSFAFGDVFTSILNFSYLHTTASAFIIPDIGIKLRRSSPNEELGIDASNSGGRWIQLPIGLSYVPDSQKAIRIYAEIPLTQNLEGLQISTDYILGIQITYNRPSK